MSHDYILTLACQDRVGIVAAVSGALAGIDGFILDSQQYADLETGRFFLRIVFTGQGHGSRPLSRACGRRSRNRRHASDSTGMSPPPPSGPGC